MNTTRTRIIAGLAVVGALTLTACDDLESAEQSVEQDAKKVEQELHDDVVSAYDAAAGFVTEMEDDVSDIGRSAYDESSAALAGLEERIDAASSKVGEEAEREYREIQHDIEALIRHAEDFLHAAGHEITDAEHAAWSGLKESYHGVANFIDHVIDRLT